MGVGVAVEVGSRWRWTGLGAVSPAGVQNAHAHLTPPQTIISLPVQTAVWKSRAEGALVVLVAVQLSVLGLYLPPVLKILPPSESTPDDHFAASPYCRVIRLGQRARW